MRVEGRKLSLRVTVIESKALTHASAKHHAQSCSPSRAGATPSVPAHRVSDGTRTRDRRDHNPELYQLSYAHQAGVSLRVSPRW